MSLSLAFIGEWFQEEAQVVRKFIIYFYPVEKSIEIFYQNTTKTFLRRTFIEDLQQRDFFIGSKVSIFGRQIDIIGYANEATKRALGRSRQKVFILIKSNVLQKVGKILDAFIKSDFALNNGLMVQLNDENARKLFGEKSLGNVEITTLINQLAITPVVGFEMIADDGQEKLSSCAAASHQGDKPKQCNNVSLQALFKDEMIRNGIYFPSNEKEASLESERFFTPENNLFNTAVLHHTTLAVIKPHAIKEGLTGSIITDITNNGFQITAIKMVILERVNCEEFYEIYRGVLHEYIQMVSQLASGVCLALELLCSDSTKNSHETFRTLCGPMDPDVGKSLRPNTLRAKYGRNKILNALHCTDLAEDATLEIEYFFKILE